MTRWLLRAAAVTVGFGGPVAAQSVSPAALASTATVPGPAVRAAAPDEAPVVLLMRTTGQPDRKLKVLKRSAFGDGESLVDVQDVTSGQTFTLPGKLADRLPRADSISTAAPPAAAPPQQFFPPPNPAVQPPLQAVVKKPAAEVPAPAPVRPNTVPPAPAPSPPGTPEWTTITPEKAVAPAPAPVPPPAAVLPGPVPPPSPGTATPVLVPVPSPVAAPPTTPRKAEPTPAPAPVPATNDRWKLIVPPQPPMPPTPSPTPKAVSSADADDGLVVRGQMPSSLGGRATSFRPSAGPAKVPPPADPPSAAPLPEKLLPSTLPRLSVPPISAPAPAPPPLLLPPVAERPRTLTPEPAMPQPEAALAPRMPLSIPPAPPPVAPASPGVVRLEPREWDVPSAPLRPPPMAATGAGDDPLTPFVLREMRPYELALTTAVRPSVRMEAAIGLSELRYAARPEVKAVLVRGAMTDPAAIVRTECIRALARLGYVEPNYMTYLSVTAGDRYAPDSLRLAAVAALQQFAPRD